MKSIGIFNLFAINLLSAMLFVMPFMASGQADIESGQYYSGSLSTNAGANTVPYFFFAESNDTVLVRVANADSMYMNVVPDIYLYYVETIPTPSITNLITSSTGNTNVVANDISSTVTNRGWYRLSCSLPAVLSAISNEFAYSVSFLRMPGYPLSYDDTDVGTIQSGESLEGTINVGADLDAATFAVSNNCTVIIRMGQKEPHLVPNIQLYDPTGVFVTNAFPPEYRAEVSAYLTGTGIYTVVCNDQLNSVGSYAVSMVQIPGELGSSDLDLGTIIAGETLSGTINQPGDMDVAFFSVVTGDVVKLTMTEVDTSINPVMELYNPSGTLLETGTDTFQQEAIITNTTTTNGTFTVICKDAEDRYNVSYTLSLSLLSGPSTSNFPAVPTGISATDGSYEDHINITWDLAAGAVGYNLWRSYGTNDYSQLCTNYSYITYDDYNVTASVIYYYKVESRNDYGTSDFSTNDTGYFGSADQGVDRRALMVGIDNYSLSYGYPALNTCTNDAIGMRDTVLLDDPSNRWVSANITTLTDVQATKSTIRSTLNSLASSSGAGDLVVYYQSSHGGKTGTNTFLCAYDASYTASDLASDLTLFHADATVIVVVDACYSAGLFKNALMPEWPFAEQVMSEFYRIKQAQLKSQGLAIPKALGQNIAFMTSSDSDEVSWTSDYYSLYTKYLIRACSVSSVDVNNDNEYEFMELQNYASNMTVQVQSQHAQTYHSSLLSATVARGVSSGVITKGVGVDNDYDGDGASDLAVYNETTGNWYIWSIQNGQVAWGLTLGGSGFMPVTGDYDGDGIADPAVYHENLGQWYIYSLQNGWILWAGSWGGAGFTPVAGDYSGDGIADLALYSKASGYWYVITLTGDAIVLGTSWTGTGFTAVPGDYNGDKTSDYAMYHNSMGNWYILSAPESYITFGTIWGGQGYTPVSGDYDGDGISDFAVYYESTGQWFIWSETDQLKIAWGTTWGGTGFTPVQGDYNDDGVSDLAVYQQETGYWFIQSVGGETIASGVSFGGPDFIPVQPAW